MDTNAPTPAPDPTGHALVAFLLGKDVTIAQIAEATGAHWRTVYRWKEGDEPLPPYRKLLRQLAEANGWAP